ncbi:MAG: ParB/RepB/Spo0J family partition protein [Lachnospiraceae bacterium]|nr:ParB/RepB/Spo0J family partition protein [Lachnospiraceae bacterium]
MAVGKKGLGRGLDVLIPPSEVKEDKVAKEEVAKAKADGHDQTLVKISMVEPNREQPRKTFNEDKIDELAESVKQYGILTPLIVQDRGSYYEIVAGERRWRAARKAGLKEVPVIIKNYSDQEIAEISLIENIQREDLNPIEEAKAYKRLLTEFKLTQDEVASKVSKSRSTITNSMRLLKLCDKVQEMLIQELISEGHARALISVEDPDKQFEIAQKIMDEKLSVREIEKLVKNIDKPEKIKPQINKELEVFYKDIAEKLKQSYGTKVQISGKGDGTGKIEIEFYSNDDLDRIVARMK